jgi:hypothetical protein
MVFAALSVTLLVASAGSAASPQSVTISVSRPSVVFGNSVTLSGKVSNHKVGEKVEVLAEPSGASSFSTLTTVDTTVGGQWTDVVKPTIETSYQAKWKSATSSMVTVKVRPLITLSLVNLSTGTFSTKVGSQRRRNTFGRCVFGTGWGVVALGAALRAARPAGVPHIV